MPLPELDDDARREALNKAAEARKLRAEMKQRLKSGEIDLPQVLARADDDEVIAKTRVSEVLEAMPKVGRVRARRLMERLDISSSRRLRGLGVNQRERLLAAFSPAGSGRRGGAVWVVPARDVTHRRAQRSGRCRQGHRHRGTA